MSDLYQDIQGALTNPAELERMVLRYLEGLAALEEWVRGANVTEYQKRELKGLIRSLPDYADGKDCAWITFMLLGIEKREGECA